LPTGGSAGNTAIGGSTTSGSGGTGVMPMAGSMTSGGKMTTAGTSSGGGGVGSAGGGAGGRGGAGGTGGAGGAGGAGGMGGKAGAGGMGGSGGGNNPTGHRYVRLQATSELAGNVWSAVAELSLFTTGDVAIARSGWVVTADSEETDDQDAPASAAIDGDINTFWHSEWEPPPDDVDDDPLPHQLVIDLGSAKPITGFSYTPRQDNANGRIGNYSFFVSTTNGNWGTAVKTGTFTAGTAAQKVTF
jgi:hypothetical protein